jgi:hypothetical protein
MKKTVLLIALLIIVLFAGCEPLSINTYTVPDCGCTVRIAGEVKRVPASPVSPTFMFLYRSDIGGVIYTVGYVELPGIQRHEFENSTWLKFVRSAAQQSGNGKFISSKRISQDGHPAREFKVRYPNSGKSHDQVERVRMFILGARVYLVGVRADTTEDIDSQRMDAYLDSFHITGVLPDGTVPKNKIVDTELEKKLTQDSTERAKKNQQTYNDLLKKIETARSAKVVIVDTTVDNWHSEPNKEYPPVITYPGESCAYLTQDPAQVATLINLVRTNIPSARDGDAIGNPTANIIFDLNNGETIEFWFNATIVEPVGVYVRDESHGPARPLYIFEKKLTFERDLYQWARSASSLRADNNRKCFLENSVNDYDFSP